MKKIFLSLITIMVTMSINAQYVKVYENGSLSDTYLNTHLNTVKIVLAEAPEPYVDLGLPSGTLWATCNVGADCPEEYGLYFAWGDTKGYKSDTSDDHSFSWLYYKWMTPGVDSWWGCTKYTFADDYTGGCWYSDETYVGTTVDGVTYTNLTKLEPADDAATANLGSDWCTPTIAQLKELMNSQYTTLTFKCKDGIDVYIIKSKINGNTLILPRAGYRNGRSLDDGCYYWSSELSSYDSSSAMALDYSSGRSMSRCYGFPIRPVRVQN